MSIKRSLICSNCLTVFNDKVAQSFCSDCHKPLIFDYQLDHNSVLKSNLTDKNSMWRYSDIMPIDDKKNIVSLGEGLTPILHIDQLGKKYGIENLFLKDEGLNPTTSFKARGISAAVSKLKELGIKECIIPTAGNAGGALSAYAASANIKATVVMPKHTPVAFQNECNAFGADVILVEGLLDKSGKKVQELKKESGAFDISTLKEPYRIEGKKTMGYEIAEGMNWELPDVVLYPTGGGTGLIGIWKAFKEMKRMGWIKGTLPKMVAVQSENCSPVVDCFHKIKREEAYTESLANGLAVPVAFGMDLMMTTLNESKGFAVTVSEKEIIEGSKEIHKKTGILVAPEGGAIWKGLLKLIENGSVQKNEKILLMNTGSGYKYMEHFL